MKPAKYYAVAVRKDDNELRELMNACLTKLMGSDKWKELIAKYIVEEQTESTVKTTANVTPVNTTAIV